MSWTCPFCQTTQLPSKDSQSIKTQMIAVGRTKKGFVGLRFIGHRCLNTDCNELSLKASVGKHEVNAAGHATLGQVYDEWDLYPRGNARPQPDYIPEPILEDYREACLIANLSPKASATLARRCLQGIIRDFCSIKTNNLHDAIKELRQEVEDGRANRLIDPATLNAIDAVRKVGNIGAHMEKDISLIVEVDPKEAMLLINLIETLFEEWYIARHERAQRLLEVVKMAEAKETQRRPKANANANAEAADDA